MWITEQRIDGCTVHIACLSDLPCDIDVDQFQQRLPIQEQARIARFHRSADRLRSVVGLYLLEHAIRTAGQAWQWEWFSRSAAGRPELRLAGVELVYDCNVSHSGDYVVCAFGPQRLGIDIEEIREIHIAEFRRYLPPGLEERIRTADIPIGEFFRWWARIESVLKADGRGICDELRTLCFGETDVQLEDHRWRYRDIDVAPGYACSLAIACS